MQRECPVLAVGSARTELKHLITLLEDLQLLGVPFVSWAEGIDATTPAGKFQMHILGAIAEFDRARIAERVRAGTVRAPTYLGAT
jgi:DNA invertase Pin-like site-specific DNA recombinase